MNKKDRQVLKYLYDCKDEVGSKRTDDIASSVGFAPNLVNRICYRLMDAGFIKLVGNWIITFAGIQEINRKKITVTVVLSVIGTIAAIIAAVAGVLTLNQ